MPNRSERPGDGATAVLDALGQRYGAWWIDFLGEHNHIGGIETTRWLFDRSGLRPGQSMLDTGAFLGAAARMAAGTGVTAFASDVNEEFLQAGLGLSFGNEVRWVAAASERLPFRAGSFDSVWALDTAMPPRELSRVAAPTATLCLCCEAPVDARGGPEAFFDEWSEYGWVLSAHRQLTLEATSTWRRAEAELVGRRAHYDERYGKRSYLAQLDLVAGMVQSYERGESGHGLYVFRRG